MTAPDPPAPPAGTPRQNPGGAGRQGFNAVLRGATLISRLALLFCLARLLPPAEVGVYGLFLVTVTYAMQAVGLDFYTFSQRELPGRPPDQRAVVLLHQAGVAGLAYLVVVPVAMAAFAAGSLPWWSAPWFAVLLASEYLAQEMNRILVAVQKQLAASTVLFLRQGAWIWIALFIMWRSPDSRGLPLVFACWLGGSVLALIVGLGRLRGEVTRPQAFRWDRQLLARGLRTGLLFLLASLCLRGMLTFDRYLFEGFTSHELLGVYTLYAGLALALMNFLDAAVFVFRFPPMIRACNLDRYDEFRTEWRRLLRHACAAVAALALPLALLGPLIAGQVGRPLYADNIDLFWWLLAAVCLQALGMIPHYGLYALRRDRPILLAHAGGLIGFLVLAAVLGTYWPRLGVPVALAAAFGGVLVLKAVLFRPLYRGAGAA